MNSKVHMGSIKWGLCRFSVNSYDLQFQQLLTLINSFMIHDKDGEDNRAL